MFTSFACRAPLRAATGTPERRTQLGREQVPPLGDARSDVRQMMEFSKHSTLAEVWIARRAARPFRSAQPERVERDAVFDTSSSKPARSAVPASPTRSPSSATSPRSGRTSQPT